MWSDNNIDNAFRRLDPAEPEPTPFPLDAWLKLESRLDEAMIGRAVRRRLWQFFAAEVAAVLLVALGWQLWPAGSSAPHPAPLLAAELTAASRPGQSSSSTVSPAAAPATTSASTGAAAVTGPAAATPSAQNFVAAPTRYQAAQATSHEALAAASAPAAAAALRSSNGGEPSAGTPATSAARAVVVGAPVSAARPLVRSLGRLSRSVRLAKGLATRSGEAGRLAPAAGPAGVTSATSVTAAASTAMAPSVASTASASSVAAARHPSLTQPVAGRPTRRPAAGGAAAEGARPVGRAREEAVAAVASHASGARLPASALGVANRPDAGATAAATAASATSGAAAGAATVSAEAGAGLVNGLRSLDAAVPTLTTPPTVALPTPLAPVAVVPNDGLPRPLRQSRLYVGLVAAPDVSTVKFADVEAPKLNWGLTVDYRLGNRLRLSTGLLRSNKQYMAHREDYDWGGYSARVYTHNFSTVGGTCTVLDVPLNLRYDLLVRPGYRLVSTVGLSSFFMQYEKYDYDWTDATGFHTWTRSAVNENRHYFSILNLAAGAEYDLGGRWSLLAEPYVKVPLAGVGLGKVKLTSAGVYVGVKYGF